MASHSNQAADQAFGPGVKGYRGDFDFTLLFEDAFLALVPSAILLIATPIRFLWLWNSSKKVNESTMRYNKLAFLVGFAILELTLLLLWAVNPSWDTPLSVPASAVDFAAACGLCVLSYFEHSRTVEPSILINLYLALSLPFDVARTRTLWMIKDFHKMAIAQSISLGLKFIILGLEAVSKRRILLEPYKDLPAEATSSIYSRSVFWWLTPLFSIGFKKNLELSDLDTMDRSLQSETLFNLYTETWAKANQEGKHALFAVVFRAIKWPLAVAAIPRLLLIGAKFSQPYLLNRTTRFVEGSDPDSIGWGLVGAYALVYLSLAVLTASYSHLQNRCITMIRGGLVSMIYSKTLDLSVTAVDQATAVTLMSSDVERITVSLQFLHDSWAAIIEIGIAIYILEDTLGVACVAPVFVTLLVTGSTAYVTKFAVPAQKIWVEAIQTRIAFTSRMLGSMRSIKLLGLGPVIEKITNGLRDLEVSQAQKFRWFLCFRILMGNLPGMITSLITFAIFVITASATGKTINTAQAFTSLSVISLLDEPLGMLLATYSSVMSSMACYDRIQNYLQGKSRQDHRLRMVSADQSSLSSGRTNFGADSDIELQKINVAAKMISEDVLVVQDASFGWSADKPVLKDVNIRIRNGNFIFVIGPVGGGKSTLLKGMLGETSSNKGFVYTSSPKVAFADQDPWIRNGTLKDNIVGLSMYDKAWFETVVEACGLEQDIDLMPDAEDTRVGSNGISLSGGQKQRLALARAVYSKKDIIMLDDVFSGLDADTEEHIFSKVFSRSGLLRQMGTTVILVTHAVHRLPYSDQVIAVKDGLIAEQGPLSALQSAGGYVAMVAGTSKEVKEKRTSTPEKPERQPRPRNEKIDQAAEDLARRSGDWSIYVYYTKSAGVLAMISFIIISALYSVALKSPEMLVSYWSAAVTKHGNSVNALYMSLYAGIEVIALMLITLALWIYILTIIPRTSSNLHVRLLYTVIRAPLSFFTRTDSGSLTNRFSQDLSIVDFELPFNVVQTSFMVFFSIFTFVLMLLSAGELAATIPFLAFVLWAISTIYLRTSRQVRLLDLEAKSPLFSQFQESLAGLATIRAFGWTDQFRVDNLKLLDDSQKPFYLLFCIQRWLAVVLDLVIAGLATVLMILVVVLRHSLNPGFVALALLNVMSFNEILASLIKSYTALETSIGAISRIRSFITETEQEVKPQEIFEPEPSWPQHGAIEVKNFSASYSVDSKLVLSDVNFSFHPGQRIGICGRSGSGKSSFLSALLHLLEYRDGFITIDNVDLAQMPRDLLRQKLNVIPQEPYFVKGTFRFNANPWAENELPEEFDKQAIAALEKVGLWEIVKEKGGLDAEMETDALSQGQKQLFCLARAMLRKSKILILDEVTSSVDVKTDKLMQDLIRTEFPNTTIIAVAHRLNTIIDFDKIAVLGAGKIVEYDTPSNLLARQSAFKELYDMH